QLAELAPVMQMMTTALSGISLAIVVFVIGLYLAASPRLYRQGLLRLVPPARRARADDVLGAVGRALRGWLLAQFISMGVIGSLVAVGLFLFGIELWLILGLLAGIL